MKSLSAKSICAALAGAAVVLPLIFFLGGCTGGKQSLKIQRYALEYPAPPASTGQQLNASIRVDDFLMARNFEARAMIYRTRAFLYSEDAYHRWRVRPSDMVSDLLTRDLRSSGIFRGVFSGGDSENTRYILNGFIEEFYEMEEQDGNRAVLVLTISLIDTSRAEREGRTVFQKRYRSVQKMEKSGADPFVRAMSLGLETLSKEIILNIHQAAQVPK